MTPQQPHQPENQLSLSWHDIRIAFDPPVEDILGLYLREIHQTALLLPEQERALASQIQKGDRHAWQSLVIANLPLVVYVARRYQGYGLELLDLVQEGAFGLMNAAVKFDPERGWRFATMATWWIRRAIQVAIADQGRTIRLPMAQVEKRQRITRAQTMLSWDAGMAATPEEIAEALGGKIEDIQKTMQQSQQIYSLDAPMDESSDPIFLAETLADPDAAEALETIEERAFCPPVSQILQILSPRQRQVLILHLGLNGEDPLPFRDIGELFGVSGERIRQIEVQALRRLRHSREGRLLWIHLRGESD